MTNPIDLVAPTGDVKLHGRPAGQCQWQRRPGRPVRGQAPPDRVDPLPHGRVRQVAERRRLPATAHPERADDAGARRPGSPDERENGLELRRQPRRQPDQPTYGLAHGLSLPANEVPAFDWITPNNCGDAHDPSCRQQPLRGLRRQRHAELQADRPARRRPRGDDARQLRGQALRGRPFLRYYIPMIEPSAALADGGMIDITFDEADPPPRSATASTAACTR